MSDRSMRGTRLGAQSLESDAGVQPAARQDVTYHCPHGHTIVVPLSVEADVPALWECRCGAQALREAALCREKLLGFSRMDRVTSDG